MSEDQEFIHTIKSFLSMEGKWSANEISNSVDAYMIDNDINQNSSTGFSPLFSASYMEDLHVVLVLLEKGADPNIRNKYSQSPLFAAAEKGNTNIITALVSSGGDVDLQDQLGRTPIMIAADLGHVGATKFMIDNSRDINLADRGGNTALHYAFKSAKKDIVEHLINNNADMSIENQKGVSGNLIKYTIINKYNEIEKHKGAAISVSANATKAPKETKKESTKFRDAVLKSRRNQSNKNRSR